MARKILKAKEPVRLRFKQLTNGNKSIYLDIYVNGKRRYDFLKLYLVPERTAADRAQNEQTMRAANAIKSQRIINVTNDEAGISKSAGRKVLLLEWLKNYPRTQAQKSRSVYDQDKCAYNTLKLFAGENTRLSDIDRDFCLKYIHFLCYEYKSANGRGLSQLAASNYYSRLVCALNAAVRNGLIARNPNSQLTASEKIKAPASQRCYLTKEELQAMIDAAPTTKAAIATKQAFLFSCFCGLRLSDIHKLQWCNISESNGQKRIEIVMQKTQEPLYIPLSQQALAYLPARGDAAGDALVFADLKSNVPINAHIHAMAAAAGINKHVTFHTARHTFATLLLTEGADIYTTSKLLGHADIATTQIYAKIVDAKKQEAVGLLDNIFANKK